MEKLQVNCRITDTSVWKCSADIVRNSSFIKKEYKSFDTTEYKILRDKIAEYLINNQTKLMPGNNTVEVPANILGDALEQDGSPNKPANNARKQTVTVPQTGHSSSAEEHPIKYMDRIRKKYPQEAEAFKAELLSFCNKHGLDPSQIMRLIAVETGGKFETKIPNNGGYAFGLIQFTEQAAKDIGVSWDVIKNSSLVEQFRYSEQYLEKQAKNRGVKLSELSLENLYLLILYPKSITAPPDADAIVIPQSDVEKYQANISIDQEDGDNDGRIERGDIRARIATR